MLVRNTKKTTLLIVMTAFVAGTAASAIAQEKGEWNKEHPRRAEVNKRLENQDKRIDKEVKEGEITKAQAGKLHKEDRQIRKEERAMASQHGGHITKQEQKTLNQQENTVSKEIGR